MDVFVVLPEGKAPLGELGLDGVETAQQLVAVGRRDDRARGQHAGVGARLRDVLRPQPAVEAQRGVQALEVGMLGLAEAGHGRRRQRTPTPRSGVQMLETAPVQPMPMRDNWHVSHIIERPRETSIGALPRGPHSLSRAEVSANQRGRMIDATIEVVGEKGYAELTVSDVIKRAGVSRRAFYEHFSNREECFFATYDSIMSASSAAVGSAFASKNGFPGSAQGAIEAIFQRALRRPDAVRVLLVEVGAAGPEGIMRRERLGAAYEDLLRERLGVPPGQGPIANPVLRGVIGGIGAVLYSHLQSGKRKQLLDLVPHLVRWTTSYWPAPPELMNLKDAGPETLPRSRVGGRAPGTLSLGAASSKRRRLVGGEHSVSPIYVAHSQRQRILDAVANLTAAHGYAALTVEGIAAEAAISLQAFYEHFPTQGGRVPRRLRDRPRHRPGAGRAARSTRRPTGAWGFAPGSKRSSTISPASRRSRTSRWSTCRPPAPA